MVETPEIHRETQVFDDRHTGKTQHPSVWKRWHGQFIRFGLVGGLNTSLDLLILNGLLWLFPTTNTLLVLLFNSLAYGLGAVNSFVFNKYWTFGQRQKIVLSEVQRFCIVTLLGIGCNDVIIWGVNMLFRQWIANATLWMNASKLIAIAGTICVSYLGMRLWVFVRRDYRKGTR